MSIIELTTYNQSQFVDLKHLIGELTNDSVLTEETLRKQLEDKNSHLYVILENDHIVGCASLCVFETLTGLKASVENVVVSRECRGRHLGRELMDFVLNEAGKLAPIEVNLTSKPIRTAANLMYLSLGFTKRITNCYQMKIH